MVVWSGRSHNQDNTVLQNGIISGPKISDSQAPSTNNTFSGTANVAVKKKDGNTLKSVFGFLRFNNPKIAGTDSEPVSAIHHFVVSSTSSEQLAGDVQIDYNGADPLACFTGANSSSSITWTPMWKTDHWRAGFIYIAMKPGTYHNLKVVITPLLPNDIMVKNDKTEEYEEGPLFGQYRYSKTSDAKCGDPIVLTAKGDVEIVRGRFTDAFALPRTAEEAAELYHVTP